MAEVFDWQPLSENVAIFRLKSLAGEVFPEYTAGQNIELYRNGITMTFSIASAPHETKMRGYLEFFVSRDNRMADGDPVKCADHASGDFTLARTEGFDSVVFVSTGTGVAPFISMIREAVHCAEATIQYTLIQGSRNFAELGYHKELSAFQAAGKLDLIYIPTISRPSALDWNRREIGKGRAGNILRRLLQMSLKGEAVLPDSLTEEELSQRFNPRSTIILACGSHASVSDIKHVAAEKGFRFEKEDW